MGSAGPGRTALTHPSRPAHMRVRRSSRGGPIFAAEADNDMRRVDMAVEQIAAYQRGPGWGVHREELEVETRAPLELVDVTDSVAAIVARSGILEGLVAVQSLHTTAAVVVNEAEPLLLHDLGVTLERAAPRHLAYRHDDFDVRTANMGPNEPANGHAHCKALFLRASETLSVADGGLRLGRWQRIFLVELDGPRRRRACVTVMGS